MEDGQVDIQQAHRAEDAIKEKNGNRCPDIASPFDRTVNVDERNEDRKRDDVLNDKNLVAPSSDW